MTDTEKLRKDAYRRYQLDWMMSHGKSAEDLIKSVFLYHKNTDESTTSGKELYDVWTLDCGFQGELWACEQEFLETEYRDKDYMKRLLPIQEYHQYLKDPACK